MTRMFIVWLALVGATLPMGDAFADSVKEQAKAHFMEGRTNYEGGQYAKALGSFEKANALAPHPFLIYNIAQVYEAMDDLPRAIAQYRRYLESNPSDAANITEKIAALGATLTTWPAIELTSVPAGATVRVGGADYPPRGETPITLRLSPTRQRLFLAKAGYKSIERPVLFSAGAKRRLNLTLTPIMPVVNVVTRPAGARVRFDGGAPAGITPLQHALPIGPHTVLVELDGHAPVTQKIELSASHTQRSPLNLNLALQRAIAKGRLALSVGGSGEPVRVDGDVVGETPFSTNIELSVGLHKIEIGRGDSMYTEMVSIRQGETTTTSISPSGGGFDKGLWGMVGMGVGGALVAGGLAAGLGALSADGDLSDCRADPACKGTAQEASLADDVRGSAGSADALVILGLAVAGGGAALYLMDMGEPETSGTTFMVSPMQGGAAAVGRIRF